MHNVTKTGYPITQAVNIDGSGWSASNILDSLFDAYTVVRRKAKGNANTIVMSFKHLGNVMKKLEAIVGDHKVRRLFIQEFVVQ